MSAGRVSVIVIPGRLDEVYDMTLMILFANDNGDGRSVLVWDLYSRPSSKVALKFGRGEIRSTCIFKLRAR
jgi:hypothetical protein